MNGKSRDEKISPELHETHSAEFKGEQEEALIRKSKFIGIYDRK